jgi:hypothetical protein
METNEKNQNEEIENPISENGNTENNPVNELVEMPETAEETKPFEYIRGDKVNYVGKDFRPMKGTFVWAAPNDNDGKVLCYIVQHPDGHEKNFYIHDGGEIRDMFHVKNPKELKDGLLYIYAQPDELQFISRKEKSSEKK